MFDFFNNNIEKLQELFFYKKQINSWIKNTYIPYCKEHNLNNFNEFLYYGWNGFCGQSFGVLSTAPEILLANIVEFKAMYELLDPDFKQDLIHQPYFKLIEKISLNALLKTYINNIIKNILKANPIIT